MDILYLLIPLSAVLVLAILGVFAWALHNGQFDELDQQGAQILEGADAPIDGYQAQRGQGDRQSSNARTRQRTEES